MSRPFVLIALAAGLAGCGLIKSQEEQPDAPDGTIVVPPDQARDVPRDAAGQPVDKGEGPVLQALGDIAAVDLGPRKGGCTFQHNDGRDLLISGASADSGVAGIGAVRTRGVIVMLKTEGDIGLNGIRTGRPKFTGGSLTVEIAVGRSDGGVPVSRAPANLGVTDASGKQRLYTPGQWVCA